MKVYASMLVYVYELYVYVYELWSHWSWGKFIGSPKLNQVVLANSAFQR